MNEFFLSHHAYARPTICVITVCLVLYQFIMHDMAFVQRKIFFFSNELKERTDYSVYLVMETFGCLMKLQFFPQGRGKCSEPMSNSLFLHC